MFRNARGTLRLMARAAAGPRETGTWLSPSLPGPPPRTALSLCGKVTTLQELTVLDLRLLWTTAAN